MCIRDSPLVAFLHGYFAPPSFYDVLSGHIASWGFLVASIGTETGFFMNVPKQAQDTHALLHWVEETSQLPEAFLFGLPDPGPWSAVGHSNGGAASFLLAADEPRVETLVTMEPTYFGFPEAAQFDGRLLNIGGTADSVNPPLSNALVYHEADVPLAERKLYAEIQGGGHNGSLDFPSALNPLPHGEQNRLHRLLVAGFLRAEVQGEESLYYELLGEGVGDEPIESRSACFTPPTWVAPSTQQPGSLSSGLAAFPGDTTLQAVSAAPAAVPTPFGTLGLDLTEGVGFVYAQGALGAEGLAEVQLPVGSGLTGLVVYFQSFAIGTTPGVLSGTTVLTLP